MIVGCIPFWGLQIPDCQWAIQGGAQMLLEFVYIPVEL